MDNIAMRDQGYRDGEQGIEPLYPESEPYMDGHNLGAMVHQADKVQRYFGNG
jgi:hypothetical protein